MVWCGACRMAVVVLNSEIHIFFLLELGMKERSEEVREGI